MIEIKNVTKSFGKIKAVNQVSFSIKDGAIIRHLMYKDLRIF